MEHSMRVYGNFDLIKLYGNFNLIRSQKLWFGKKC